MSVSTDMMMMQGQKVLFWVYGGSISSNYWYMKMDKAMDTSPDHQKHPSCEWGQQRCSALGLNYELSSRRWKESWWTSFSFLPFLEWRMPMTLYQGS
jgi:hypothetical protein